MNSELLSSINIPAIITSNNLTIMSMNAAALQYFKYYENNTMIKNNISENQKFFSLIVCFDRNLCCKI